MKRFLIGCIRLYQVTLSPLFSFRCRFFPSCSQYAIYAIETSGVFRGVFLTIKRLIRCRPTMKDASKSIGVSWGYDPVPRVVPKKGQEPLGTKGGELSKKIS